MAIFSTQEISNLISIQLNTLSQSLYDDEEITSKIYFYGTSDVSTYERIQLGEYELDDYQKITPFILRSINFSQEPEDYTRYEEAFELKIYGYLNEKTDLEKIFNVYTQLENTSNRVVALDTYRIEKSTSKLTIFPEILQSQDGRLEDRIEGTLSFIWSIAKGITTSDDITITIDGDPIPYNMLSLTSEKRTVNTQLTSTTGITTFLSSVMGYNLVFNLPYLTTNTKLTTLFEDVWNKKYNKKYAIVITIAENIVLNEDVYLVSGSFIDPKPTILDFEVVFNRVPKQTEIKIDDVGVPVLEFNISNKAEVSPSVKINEDSTKSTYLSSNFTINMTLPLYESDSSNTTISGLLADVLEGAFGTSYIIKIIRDTFEKEYNVILIDGTYSFSTDSNGTMEITFTEEDVD
jgi:hypothetical protein